MDAAVDAVVEIFTWVGLGAGALLAGIALIAYLVDGTWVPVPAQAVIRDTGNPIGDAVVWYTRYDDMVIIRCFVPASEV